MKNFNIHQYSLHVSLVYGKNSILSTKFQLQEAWTIGNMGFDLKVITYIEVVSCPFWSILPLIICLETLFWFRTQSICIHLSHGSLRVPAPVGNRAFSSASTLIDLDHWPIVEPKRQFSFVLWRLYWKIAPTSRQAYGWVNNNRVIIYTKV